MKVTDALSTVARLFLDTGPISYLIERNPRYIDVVLPTFENDGPRSLLSSLTPRLVLLPRRKRCYLRIEASRLHQKTDLQSVRSRTYCHT